MTNNRVKAMDQCVRQLCTAVSTASLYSADHAQVVRLLASARESLLEAIGGSRDISLVRVDDQLAVDNQPLSASLYVDRFARMLRTSGIGHVKFLKEITSGELQSLIRSMALRESTVRSSEHLKFGQVEVRVQCNSAKLMTAGGETNLLDGVSSEELGRIMEVYEAVIQKRKLHVKGLTEIVSEFIDVFGSYSDPLLTLVPLRSMDEYTFTHSLNVCLLNLAQASALGVTGPMLHDIGLSAMLHDIGKLFLPEEILNKPERLEASEWEILKGHTVKGAEYLVQTPGVPRMAVVNAYEHHMRYDGFGYPSVSSGWQQNLCSHMTAISDVFDSLRTYRPYRTPMSIDEVLSYLPGLSGKQLHPLLVENFLRMMKKVHVEH